MKRFIRIRLLRFHIVGLLLLSSLVVSAQEMNEIEWNLVEVPSFSSISFWPQYQMSENGQLLISGTPDRIDPLLLRQPQLVSGDDSVRLLPLAHYVLSSTFHQVILAPERNLIPEREYRLQGRDKRLRDSAGNLMRRDEEYRIYIRNGVDTLSPLWVEPPTYVGGCYRAQEHYLYIAIAVDESDPIVVEITLTEENGNKTTFYTFPRRDIAEQFDSAFFESRTLPLQLNPSANGSGMSISIPDHLMLAIGRGKYGGGIEFAPGGKYKVQMRAMDASGNYSAQSQEGIITIPPPSPQSDSQQRLPVAGDKNSGTEDADTYHMQVSIMTETTIPIDTTTGIVEGVSEATLPPKEPQQPAPQLVNDNPEEKVLPMIPRFDRKPPKEEN
ncbi:MAG: hypothetical protein AB7H80_16855 [Candidatus Kapaibacterium sp.]